MDHVPTQDRPAAPSATLKASSLAHHPDPAVASAVRTLSTWIALETLSPQTFRKPADLATEAGLVDSLEGPDMPWKDNSGEPIDDDGLPRRRVYHQVVLGSIPLDPASRELMKAFGSDEERGFPGGSRVAVASVTLAWDGTVAADGVAVSSFAWALPKALARRFDDLYKWDEAEARLCDKITELLTRTGDGIEPLPVRPQELMKAHAWLVKDLGLDPDMVEPPEFSVRSYRAKNDEELPEPLLANSLFIKDLGSARARLFEGNAGLALRRYMGVTPPETVSSDITRDHEVLARILHPSAMPAGRWPSPGGHPLTLMQQAAVNAAIASGKDGGIMGVQGPPGTGKTTLLRDIVAANVVARASAIAALPSPAAGFEREAALRFEGPDGNYRVHEMHESLRGFEMVVASSNNKAVENVTLELPQARAVGRAEARHFRSVSDALANPPAGKGSWTVREEPLEIPRTTWGLVAAALGNGRNRRRFRNTFWDHPDFGFRAYLAEVLGHGGVDIKDEDGKRVIGRRSSAVAMAENPPVGRNAPFENWKTALRRFRTLEAQVAEAMAASVSAPPAKADRPDVRAAEAALEACLSRRPRGLPNLSSPGWKAWKDEETRLRDELAAARQAAGFIPGPRADAAFLSGDHETVQTASPWLSPAVHALREELFLAALDLHRAFIDFNAEAVENNLRCMMLALVNGLPQDGYVRSYWPHMWSTLCLVVPVVSTTFASVNAMFAAAPRGENIAWLLVDEAGQATPQAAVGAVMRSRTAVVVGDPLQIEPVVTLPSELVRAIADSFSVDADTWTAPSASAQVLADRASAVTGKAGSGDAVRTVGMPLLVHRRCLDPMFSISNQVAYGGAMVYRTAAYPDDLVTHALGPSRWLDVDVEADHRSKWSEAEGAQLAAMMTALADAGVADPDIFVITPFREVARGARAVLRREAATLERLGLDPDRWLADRVGTVHTVQGREADTVFLVLGAPSDGHAGARAWAGGTPNMLNVAVSRARKRLYVIGRASAWEGAGSFAVLAERMPLADCEI